MCLQRANSSAHATGRNGRVGLRRPEELRMRSSRINSLGSPANGDVSPPPTPIILVDLGVF